SRRSRYLCGGIKGVITDASEIYKTIKQLEHNVLSESFCASFCDKKDYESTTYNKGDIYGI
ncbi:MAG: hypothetical protein JTJ12_18485, partial [Eubacterium sp.]|nr:hypothetical protein [Eubacterium sp.]